MKKLLAYLMTALAMGWAAPAAAQAAKYPAKPIRIIVPFGAGGATDTVARTFATRMATTLGQQVNVENKTGASGMLAADFVAKSDADGYTLLLGTNTTNAAITSLFKSVPYDPQQDFAPISSLAIVRQVVLVNKDSPVRDLQELIAHVKANPGKLQYGWVSSSERIATDMLATKAGLNLVNIPYRNTGQAITGLMRGEIQLYIGDLAISLPHIRGGNVRALALTSFDRSAIVPDLPTVAEAGNLPGFGLEAFLALFAPAGTPPEIVRSLHAAVHEAQQDASVRTTLSNVGIDVRTNTPEQLRAQVRDAATVWTKAAADAGIKPQ